MIEKGGRARRADNVFRSAIPAAGRSKRRAHPCCRECSADGRLDTMRTGVDPNGHQMSEQMPWRPLGRMDNEELAAVYEYLTPLPSF
jgi:hypothetical protein